MKLTIEQLKRIIREEISLLEESLYDDYEFEGPWWEDPKVVDRIGEIAASMLKKQSDKFDASPKAWKSISKDEFMKQSLDNFSGRGLPVDWEGRHPGQAGQARKGPPSPQEMTKIIMQQAVETADKGVWLSPEGYLYKQVKAGKLAFSPPQSPTGWIYWGHSYPEKPGYQVGKKDVIAMSLWRPDALGNKTMKVIPVTPETMELEKLSPSQKKGEINPDYPHEDGIGKMPIESPPDSTGARDWEDMKKWENRKR